MLKIGFSSYLYGTDWKLQEITKVRRTDRPVRRTVHVILQGAATFNRFLNKGPSDDENVAHL